MQIFETITKYEIIPLVSLMPPPDDREEEPEKTAQSSTASTGLNLPSDPREFGKLIKNTRKRSGKNQADFAEELGIDQSTLSRLERGASWTEQYKVFAQLVGRIGFEPKKGNKYLSALQFRDLLQEYVNANNYFSDEVERERVISVLDDLFQTLLGLSRSDKEES
jgi:transcriptional regulator with XRE-family HTH domain